ncbi:hypothetical protein CspHIS471_0108170 [Cutaneotrichosporon sp. HIS471]|nr:hypothetical protein CspHIS471_0108170 [Cutaneotrichosporon sp. HIS471]
MSEKTSILDTATLVTISGRQLETFSLGDGPDLVLFESGGGSSGAVWGRVVESLAIDARIVIYNRAGYGRSWAVWDKRTLSHLVHDLLHLLETMEYRRLVLVGHSWGGPVIRSVAANLGEKCTGLVLVDATDEGNSEYFGGMEEAFYRNSWMILPKALWGSLAIQKEEQLKGIQEPYRSKAVRDCSSFKAAWMASYEIANIVPGLRELVASPAILAGKTAVTCISGQIPHNKMRTEQNAAHRRRAQLAGQRGKYVPANKSGHAVHHTEPQLIADEIATILAPKP